MGEIEFNRKAFLGETSVKNPHLYESESAASPIYEEIEASRSASPEPVMLSSPVPEDLEGSSAASLVAEASSPASSPIEGSPRLESPDHEEPATLSPAVSSVVVAHKESDVISDINEALRGANRNSKNTSDKGYENNCQRCCVAYELRRRGENVVAKPFNREDEDKELVLVVNLFEQIPEKMDLEGNGAVLIQNIKIQMKKWGNGSRAMISFTVADRVSGHCFIAEQVNGETVFLDPQQGKRIEDLNRWFRPNLTIPFVSLAKIDKVKFTENLINDCCDFEQS